MMSSEMCNKDVLFQIYQSRSNWDCIQNFLQEKVSNWYIYDGCKQGGGLWQNIAQ